MAKKKPVFRCGLPLHYDAPALERFVEKMIHEYGGFVVVTVEGRKWMVPRHYLALHGINLEESLRPRL